MLDKPVMMCGHQSTGNWTEDDGTKIPVCMECWQTNREKAKTIATVSDRIALCTICGKKAPSDPELFNFVYMPEAEFDRYYDGCRGW